MLDLSELNPAQREAVQQTEGPLLVLAGAGSGKTRVIAHRVAYLLTLGVSPESILALTFTNKAAAEMRQRVVALAGEPGRRVVASTFHSFGLRFLEEHKERAGLAPAFSICDSGDQLAILKRCMRDLSVDDRRLDPNRLLALINQTKEQVNEQVRGGRSRRDPGARATSPGTEDQDYAAMAEAVGPRYLAALRSQRTVDFDDLIAIPTRLLRQDAALQQSYRTRFRYVLVDEYQDTSSTQLSLLRQLVSQAGNVCVVGDDDQSIYGWRGAEIENILRFGQHFGGDAEIRLEQNYRSTASILACANAVIAKNPKRKPKRLWTAETGGEKVRLVAMDDDEEEARFVASEIVAGRAEGRPTANFAVLFRLNSQARPLEEALRERGIPYQVRGATSFFDRAEVRDAIAYLRLCASVEDELSLLRVINVPARGIGEASIERLREHAQRNRTSLWRSLKQVEEAPAAEPMRAFHDMIERHREHFAAEPLHEAARSLFAELDLAAHARASVQSAEAGARRADGIDHLIRSMEGFAIRSARPTLERYLHRLSLDRRGDDDQEEGVALMTLHAAKGLEFSVVFLVGCEEGLLPANGIQGEVCDPDEERRLCYVGITRARERLTLTRARSRKRRGRSEPRTPSRFLAELPEDAAEIFDPTNIGTPADVASRASDVLTAMRARLSAQLSGP